MTSFVESCVTTVAGSAAQIERRSRVRHRARLLLRTLANKKNILITTHHNPDPDALAAVLGLCALLRAKLPGVQIRPAIKGRIGGGLNTIFAQQTDLPLLKWEDLKLEEFDAIVLVDVQPQFSNSPLPPGIAPTAVIDHHRSVHRRPKCDFCDIRAEVGASSSIVFSYFMELEESISADLAAILLFAIESDLAGAAGKPGELDNIALSSLTLVANTRKLYQMRYVDMPQSYYVAYASGLASAVFYDNALMAHIDTIDSAEQPAIIADFLLRFDKVQFSLVSAVSGDQMVLSMRTDSGKLSAADVMRKLIRKIGEGGGHRAKAGGAIPLATGSAAEIDRLREVLRRRYLRALGIKGAKPQKLVP